MKDAEAAGPTLRIVSGEPDAEELAALTALLTARSGEGPQPDVTPRGGWSDPARMVRRTLRPGPNAWRSSGW